MIAAAAARAGLPNEVITELDDNNQAVDYLKEHMKANEIVLVKGSRGMHMEQIVAALESRE